MSAWLWNENRFITMFLPRKRFLLAQYLKWYHIAKKKKKGFLHDFSFQNNSFNYNGKKFSGNLINYDQLTTITKKKNLTMLHIWWDDLWHFFKMIVAVNLFDLFEPNCNSLSKICFLQLFPDTKRKKKKSWRYHYPKTHFYKSRRFPNMMFNIASLI